RERDWALCRTPSPRPTRRSAAVPELECDRAASVRRTHEATLQSSWSLLILLAAIFFLLDGERFPQSSLFDQRHDLANEPRQTLLIARPRQQRAVEADARQFADLVGNA